MATVCGAVIARDEAANIERCLGSLAWADRLLVVLDAIAPGDRLLLALFASPMGEAKAFEPVACSDGDGSSAVRTAGPPARRR